MTLFRILLIVAVVLLIIWEILTQTGPRRAWIQGTVLLLVVIWLGSLAF